MSTYVQVMVPEEQLAAVYRLLISAQESAPSRPGAATQELLPPPAAGWRDPTFVRTHLGPRSETIRGLAKYLAERPGQAVTAEAAADALHLPYGWNSLAGALGAFGNYLANRGIEFPWSAVTDPEDWRVRLTMDEPTATAVMQAL
ncbi:MAG: hypothetical protein QOJ85_1866 [Solirubrobacteraceae bacterium]|jgi:hypothetical protein|nr:hypothetical protein [Solirubrobacteraceae bacterium]MEA2242898.1 hypothetical protein [Solirubrobacteraceae bacterium]